MSANLLYRGLATKIVIIAGLLLISVPFCDAAKGGKIDESLSVPLSENGRHGISPAAYSPENVRHIQTLLSFLKFNPGPIDGMYGPRTQAAIKAFQADNSLPVTGMIDEALAEQLENAFTPPVSRDQAPETPEVKSEVPDKNPEKKLEVLEPTEPAERQSGTGIEMKPPEVSDTVQQQDIEAASPKSAPANSYLKYILLAIPMLAFVFCAYLYRRRRSRNFRSSQTENTGIPEAQNHEDSKIPAEEFAMPAEIQDLKEEVAPDGGAAGSDSPKPVLKEDQPSHPGFMTPVVRRKVWARSKGQCAMCGSRQNLGYSYIMPISEGGSNKIENLQLLCKACESTKTGKSF